ncbi:MAG: stage III sporulation AC/AD family protein [Oscillospiraceae bacterium]|nr:stage III sporulation AC/AD family protein [Oscillospiraceae bacterium]
MTVLLTVLLNKQGKDMALLLTAAVCCMVITVVITYLEPVLDFVKELQTLGSLDSDMVRILLKAVGVSLVAEIAALICADCGNSALGKAVHILAIAVVLWLSLPLLRALMDMIQKMLGEV